MESRDAEQKFDKLGFSISLGAFIICSLLGLLASGSSDDAVRMLGFPIAAALASFILFGVRLVSRWTMAELLPAYQDSVGCHTLGLGCVLFLVLIGVGSLLAREVGWFTITLAGGTGVGFLSLVSWFVTLFFAPSDEDRDMAHPKKLGHLAACSNGVLLVAVLVWFVARFVF